MLKDRIQWEDIPDHVMTKWLSAYDLGLWPFKEHDKHVANREKIAKIYSEIQRVGNSQGNEDHKEADHPEPKRLPQDPELKTLYDILKKSRCAVFNDAKLKRTINSKETSEFKTCEIAVRDINRFIESL